MGLDVLTQYPLHSFQATRAGARLVTTPLVTKTGVDVEAAKRKAETRANASFKRRSTATLAAGGRKGRNGAQKGSLSVSVQARVLSDAHLADVSPHLSSMAPTHLFAGQTHRYRR